MFGGICCVIIHVRKNCLKADCTTEEKKLSPLINYRKREFLGYIIWESCFISLNVIKVQLTTVCLIAK